MYGLVNQGIKDLVLKIADERAWTTICKSADVPEDYVSMEYYEDHITYKLIGSTSKYLNIPAESILAEFGKFWVKYTAKEGYGPLMDLFGQNFKSSLVNLNQLHMRMGMTMPNLSPPSFEFKEIQENKYELEYQSKRSGLSPMVEGLLRGLAEKYNVKIEIKFQEIGTRKFFYINVLDEL